MFSFKLTDLQSNGIIGDRAVYDIIGMRKILILVSISPYEFRPFFAIVWKYFNIKFYV